MTSTVTKEQVVIQLLTNLLRQSGRTIMNNGSILVRDYTTLGFMKNGYCYKNDGIPRAEHPDEHYDYVESEQE